MDFSLFKPKLSSMQVHSATCSCSVELYKQWYTLADFLSNWNFRGFSLYIIHQKEQRSCDGRGTLYFLGCRVAQMGCSAAQKDAA